MRVIITLLRIAAPVRARDAPQLERVDGICRVLLDVRALAHVENGPFV